MIGAIKNLVKKVFSNVQIDISLEVIPASEIRLEVDFSLVASLTEAEYVWSDFYNRPFSVGALHYSHTDTNGIAGYRVAGTNTLVWRDQLSVVQFVAAA